MGTGSALEDKVYAEVKRLCYAGLDERMLLREVTRRLWRVVPFEAYCANQMDPSSGLITGTVTEGIGGASAARFFLEHVYFEDEVTEYNFMVRSRRPVALLSEATGGKLERALRHREVCGPAGLDYELRSVFTSNRELWAAMDLYRERGAPDFSANEVAFLRRVAPHLGTGLRAAVLLSQASLVQEGDRAPGVLVLDRRGWLLHYTAAAERWLYELEEDPDSGRWEGRGPSAWREGKGLPTAVWTMMGTLRQALKPQTDRDLNEVPHLCVRARSRCWLTLHGSLTESTPDRESEMVIVIEPSGPREVTWLRATAYGLSPRERAVVDLVVRGASTRQISQALYISEYTVQDHLSNIFDKIEVRDRRTLVKRLYLDAILPEVL
jgi:DNA-binding CsgD family transcriptional regulator